MLQIYDRLVTSEHLDVGVGTGWFLANAKFPTPKPSITLMDFSAASLNAAADRIAAYVPQKIEADILNPLPPIDRKFGSIALNYLLHCVPGNFEEKMPKVLSNLVPLLKKDGVFFGATILGKGVVHNAFGRKLMDLYNAKGFFFNSEDSLEALRKTLEQKFKDVRISQKGVVALFECREPL